MKYITLKPNYSNIKGGYAIYYDDKLLGTIYSREDIIWFESLSVSLSVKEYYYIFKRLNIASYKIFSSKNDFKNDKSYTDDYELVFTLHERDGNFYYSMTSEDGDIEQIVLGVEKNNNIYPVDQFHNKDIMEHFSDVVVGIDKRVFKGDHPFVILFEAVSCRYREEKKMEKNTEPIKMTIPELE